MRRAAVVVAVLLLAGVAGVAVAQSGPAILEAGCTGSTAWVRVEGEGVAPYAWFDTDRATGGWRLVGGEVDFGQFDTWRIGHSGQGRPLRFEMGDERAYFGEGCVVLGEPAPISPLPLPYRAAVEQRLYLPQVVTP